jgi:hypothetical protein
MVIGDFMIVAFSVRCYDDPLFLDKPFITMPVAMVTFPNHFMFQVINEVMEKIIPAGIPQYWYSLQKWERYIKTRVKIRSLEELKSLSLDDDGFGFVIWLVACGVSSAVFLVEMLSWPWVKVKWARNWKIRYGKSGEKMKMKQPVCLTKPTLDEEVLNEINRSLDIEIKEFVTNPQN